MSFMSRLFIQVCLLAGSFLAALPALAQDDADIAKQLANPVASLISVPIQANYDDDFGLYQCTACHPDIAQ